MKAKKEFEQAKALILNTLDRSYPEPTTLDDRDIGFYAREDISSERDRRARILDDAFSYLRQEGLIEYASPDGRIPRVDIKLTTKGLDRSRLSKTGKEPWWASFDRRIAVVSLIVAILALAVGAGLLKT